MWQRIHLCSAKCMVLSFLLSVVLTETFRYQNSMCIKLYFSSCMNTKVINLHIWQKEHNSNVNGLLFAAHYSVCCDSWWDCIIAVRYKIIYSNNSLWYPLRYLVFIWQHGELVITQEIHVYFIIAIVWLIIKSFATSVSWLSSLETLSARVFWTFHWFAAK